MSQGPDKEWRRGDARVTQRYGRFTVTGAAGSCIVDSTELAAGLAGLVTPSVTVYSTDRPHLQIRPALLTGFVTVATVRSPKPAPVCWPLVLDILEHRIFVNDLIWPVRPLGDRGDSLPLGHDPVRLTVETELAAGWLAARPTLFADLEELCARFLLDGDPLRGTGPVGLRMTGDELTAWATAILARDTAPEATFPPPPAFGANGRRHNRFTSSGPLPDYGTVHLPDGTRRRDWDSGDTTFHRDGGLASVPGALWADVPGLPAEILASLDPHAPGPGEITRCPDGSWHCVWYAGGDGRRHRDDGPAVQWWAPVPDGDALVVVGEAWYADGVEHRVDGPALTGIETPDWPDYWPADDPRASSYRVRGQPIRPDSFAAVLDVHHAHPIGLEALWDLVLELPAAVRDDPARLRDVLHESLG